MILSGSPPFVVILAEEDDGRQGRPSLTLFLIISVPIATQRSLIWSTIFIWHADGIGVKNLDKQDLNRLVIFTVSKIQYVDVSHISCLWQDAEHKFQIYKVSWFGNTNFPVKCTPYIAIYRHQLQRSLIEYTNSYIYMLVKWRTAFTNIRM